MQLPFAKPQQNGTLPSHEEVKDAIEASIQQYFPDLKDICNTIHSNPELAWEEKIAHEKLTAFLSAQKFDVTPSAYGMATAFEARNKPAKAGRRSVNFNAEYDALPDIGHACGHNLIATASLTGFLALSAMIEKYGVAGNVQLLGTPAEEAGGGKCNLIEAGAYKGIDVSLMGHPFAAEGNGDGKTGTAGMRSIAHLGIIASFHGKNAHAGANPWDGVNALDAVVASYNTISMLRQQMRPDERIHGCIMDAPKVTNVIPKYTQVMYSVRSPTMKGARELGDRVRACFEAAGLATGCKVELEEEPMFADLRINNTLCDRYVAGMKDYGEDIRGVPDEVMTGSTDQGNVSYEVPALHSMFGIPGGEFPHNAKFAEGAGTPEALEAALRAGKAMALVGWEILTDDALFKQCREDFEADKKLR